MATTNKRFVAKNGLDNNNQTITNIGAAGTSLGLSGTGDLTIAVSGTATLTIPAGSDTLVTLSGAQTLTNKTISGSNNTLSNIGNGSLTNSSVSFNGVSVALGASGTLYTDDISEDGSPTNKYFTDARARAAISVTDSGGDGSLSYDSGTGVITYTGPSATEVRAHLSAGTGLTYTTGQFAIDNTVVTLTGTQTLENKTLTTPVISAITNTGTLTLPTSTDTLVGRATTDTLSNKTISGASNTISNIGNGSLTNSSITINGTSVSLGGTRTLVTDDIAEDGSPVNLWYTDTRARNAISVTDAGGDGSLSYSSGVITYTGPSASEVRAHFSAGTGVTITSGQVAIGQAVATTDNVTFAGVTADNVRVGVTAAGEIDTSTGNLTIDSAGGTTTIDDDATVTGNLQVDGNLTVSGTTVTINATNLAVEDNMIYLNNGSTVSHPDLGFAGNYNDGTYRHAGVFRDATDGVWKFFHQYTPEPDASAFIDTSHGSFALAPIQASSFTGSVTGNASTATTWQTARTLSLTGDVTGTSAAFDGSGNISITTTIAADSVALGTDTTGNYVASITNGSYITGGDGGTEGAALTLAVDATSANTASKVVARDASGNFSAGTITATLSGNASTVTNGVYTTDTGTVTNTMLAGSIANNKLANSTISGISLGGNLATLTLDVSGTGLSGSQTYNGSSAATFTVTSNATSANTASTIVARDASGNFTAGTITAALSGNATSATTAGTITSQANSATITATSANTANQIVLRDGSGNFSAGTITATLSGNATSATSASNSTTTSQRAFTSDISTTGQGRFTGWYTGNAATGLAAEIGISGGEGYVFTYNRDTSTYGTMNFAAASANLKISGSTINATSGALQQGGNQVLHAGNYSSYALPLSGGTMTGTLYTASTSAVVTSDHTRILHPGGASYVTTTSTVTGAIKIKMPVLGSGMMMTARATIYEYTANKSFEVVFGGHRDGNDWYNVFAYQNGDESRSDITVRFGIDGSTNCVWIGETNTSWSYPQVFVTDVQLGYTGYSSSWHTGWSISFVTSFDSVSRTSVAYRKISSTGTGASGTWGINITGTAGSAPANGGTSTEVNGSRFSTTASSYVNFYTWAHFHGGTTYGLYFPSSGSMTHMYPSATTYGSFMVDGSRNGYWGAMFSTGVGNAGWMTTGNTTGFYNHTYGWKYYHENSRFYSFSSTYGGGNALSLGLYNNNNVSLYSGTTGVMGLLGADSGGTFKWQLYGEGSSYGLLQSAWGSWDLRKVNDSQLYIKVSGTEYTALHSGNYGSYALPLSGGTLTGVVRLNSASYFTADSATGYRFNSSTDAYNNMIIYDSGTVYIRTSLGVGTSSPSQQLHITGYARMLGFVIDETGGTRSAFVGYEKNWIGSGSSNNLAISSETSNSIKFYTNGSATLRMELTTAGTLNVGGSVDSGAISSYLSGYNAFGARVTNNAYFNFTGLNASGTRTFYVTGSGSAYFGDTVDFYGGVRRTNVRLSSDQNYPLGHYTPGETVFEIDPTWSQSELQEFFGSSGVSWVSDSTAPGGYAIQVSGPVYVGGAYNSGFPYIPVDQDDVFMMECWIKDVAGTNGHYMGSIDYNASFSSLGGNPGSYGYWVMLGNYPGTSWTRYVGYIGGFGSSTGQFVSGTKYWTPQALFNYAGQNTSYISGWKAIKVSHRGNHRFLNNVGIGGGHAPDVALSVNGVVHIGNGGNFVYMGGTVGNYGSWGSRHYTSGGNNVNNANTFQFDNVGYGSTWTVTFNSSGITASGNITAYSDIRLKENIMKIENALDKVQQLRGITYTRNDTDDTTKRHAGVIAQEVEQVLPEVVDETSSGIKHVAYGNMIGLLIEAIKELKQDNEQLHRRIQQWEDNS